MGMIGLHGGAAAIGLALTAAGPPAAAQQPTGGCLASSGVAASPELAGWNVRVPLTAAAKDADMRAIAIGQAIDATLHPAARMRYVLAPNKADEPAEYGGLFRFDIAAAGTYRVALGAGAWIDILAGKVSLPSIAHTRGPECSGVRKMVDFRLAAGRYVLQLSAGRAAVIPVMIVRLP